MFPENQWLESMYFLLKVRPFLEAEFVSELGGVDKSRLGYSPLHGGE